MRIGVVSDTHGHLANTRAAIQRLAELQVELIIHCGDIGSPRVVPLFENWPTHFVFGNVDGDEEQLQAAILAAGQTCHGRFGSFEAAGTRIAVLHSDDRALFQQTIGSEKWDLVCYGHSHVAEQHFQGKTLVLNPGALYRADPHTLATVELPDLVATHHRVPRA
jgi:uncharacterized protein